METKVGFFQFEIIINMLVSSFRFIRIPMNFLFKTWRLKGFFNTYVEWVYYRYKYLNSFSAGMDFIRPNLTSTDVRFWRLKLIAALKGFRFNDISLTFIHILILPDYWVNYDIQGLFELMNGVLGHHIDSGTFKTMVDLGCLFQYAHYTYWIFQIRPSDVSGHLNTKSDICSTKYGSSRCIIGHFIINVCIYIPEKCGFLQK